MTEVTCVTLVVHPPLWGPQTGLPPWASVTSEKNWVAGAGQPPARLALGNPMQGWGLGGRHSSWASCKWCPVLGPRCQFGVALCNWAVLLSARPGALSGSSAPRDPGRWSSTSPTWWPPGILGKRWAWEVTVSCVFMRSMIARRLCQTGSACLRGGIGQRRSRPMWQGQHPAQALCRCLPMGTTLFAFLKLYFVRNLDT